MQICIRCLTYIDPSVNFNIRHLEVFIRQVLVLHRLLYIDPSGCSLCRCEIMVSFIVTSECAILIHKDLRINICL